MQENILNSPIKLVRLENYKFSGLDASLVGAIKSVVVYYQIPLTASWIYGMLETKAFTVVKEIYASIYAL